MYVRVRIGVSGLDVNKHLVEKINLKYNSTNFHSVFGEYKNQRINHFKINYFAANCSLKLLKIPSMPMGFLQS